tara:strand:- start:113 stop:781 length:669 start_codon:yes stop_codon:yes gene_type:complete
MKLIRKEWEVKPVDKNQAKDFVIENHYAQGCGNVIHASFGLFYKGDHKTLHGVSMWNPPAFGAAKQVQKDNPQSVLSLTRFCLVEERPENAGSFLISKSIKMLDKKWMHLLTYADTALNHDGGLYRASNWNYDGLTGLNGIWRDPNTNQMISRKSGKKTRSMTTMRKLGYIYEGEYRKHKFLYNNCNRKNIIINSRLTDHFFFTKDGQTVINWGENCNERSK